jgi:hypothetical protein
MLKPYREEVFLHGSDPLHWSAGRYADAYLPVGYTQEDLDEALQELVYKAQKFDETLDEAESWINDELPQAADRPTRYDYLNRRKPWR